MCIFLGTHYMVLKCWYNSFKIKHAQRYFAQSLTHLIFYIEKTAYNALFFPTLTLCHITWGIRTKRNLYKLLIAQRECKGTTSALRHTHTSIFFATNNILNVLLLDEYRLPCSYRRALLKHNLTLLNVFKLPYIARPLPP